MPSLLPVIAVVAALISNVFSACIHASELERRGTKLAPKIVLFSMFPDEAEVWYGIEEFDILAQNITVPGLSPLFPDLHCTSDGEICQVTIGEAGMLFTACHTTTSN